MLVLGIAGGTACGKTTFVNQLIKDLDKDITLLSQDDYYPDLSHLSYEERVRINFDHPDSIDFDLLAQQLATLKEGKSIKKPNYSFVDHNRMPATTTLSPTTIIIVEGILIFSQESLRKLLDLNIFIQADADIRFIRRLNRDLKERGRDLNEICSRYIETLKPMHDKYIQPSKAYADLVITNNDSNPFNMDETLQLIKSHS